MALWRCPHCATLQPVASRCWVCRRSSTSCGTCRHFRASVAAKIGYCGLDRSRQPLAGDEIRACWDGLPLAADDAAGPAQVVAIDDIATPGYVGGFVPVEVAAAAAVTRLRPSGPPRPRRRAPEPVATPVAAPVAPPQPGPAPDGMLWADLDG